MRHLPSDRKDFESARACPRKQVHLRESWDQNDNSFPFWKRIARFRPNHNNPRADLFGLRNPLSAFEYVPGGNGAGGSRATSTKPVRVEARERRRSIEP